MTLSIMVYGAILGALLAGAAHSLDYSLRSFGRPARWLWASAMAGTALVPPLVLLLPERTPALGAGTTLIPAEALYRLWRDSGLQATATRTLPELLDRPLSVSWMAASVLMVLLVSVTTLRLRKRAARWARYDAAGEEVLISDGLGPAVLGFLHPRIVLPPWALDLKAEDLKMVLLHEAEHRRARDPAVLATGLLLTALAPWNPALWWQLRRLRLAVEGDCDARVLDRGVSRRRYGSLLLGVASEARGLFPLTPALSESGGSFLERRLQMMKERVRKGRIGVAAVGIFLGGACLALACETPTPPQVQEEALQEGVLVETMEDGAGGTSSYSFRAVDPASSADGAEAPSHFRFSEGGAGQDGPVAGVLLKRTGEGDALVLRPLVFIDGALQEGGEEAIKGLNPDRIERIEVVKGGAAEAIFGAEAAGGVIQIFLKKQD